jgi:hypothetical protein
MVRWKRYVRRMHRMVWLTHEYSHQGRHHGDHDIEPFAVIGHELNIRFLTPEHTPQLTLVEPILE